MATSPRYGIGSGTNHQEFIAWIRAAGRITVHEEGEQLSLLQPEPVKMLRLFGSKASDSILVSAQWAAQFGIYPRSSSRTTRPIQPVLGESQTELF